MNSPSLKEEEKQQQIFDGFPEKYAKSMNEFFHYPG